MKDENIDFYNSAIKYLQAKYKINGISAHDMSRYNKRDHRLVKILEYYHCAYGKLKGELRDEVRRLKIKLIKYGTN